MRQLEAGLDRTSAIFAATPLAPGAGAAGLLIPAQRLIDTSSASSAETNIGQRMTLETAMWILTLLSAGLAISSIAWDRQLRRKHPHLRVSLWVALEVSGIAMIIYYGITLFGPS
jgi:hypothetical protein